MGEAAKPFSTTETGPRFEKSYRHFPASVRKQIDKSISHLTSNPAHPGLESHPIKPDRYYWEAYVNKGVRLIYRPQGSHLVLVDVVTHDDIKRYGCAPKASGE
jgi:mRNA-degrading endonuclease YafQ of YafQ-DinJ toxin-antitoxin module